LHKVANRQTYNNDYISSLAEVIITRAGNTVNLLNTGITEIKQLPVLIILDKSSLQSNA